jgi:hypothetical protein
MKFLLLTLLMLISSRTYAFPQTAILYCSNPNGFGLHVNVTATDQAIYRIRVMDQYYNPMQAYNGRLTFNEAGEIAGINAYATVESLELKLINEAWVGEYWFDNVRYQLTCKKII